DDPRTPLTALPEVPWLQPVPDALLGSARNGEVPTPAAAGAATGDPAYGDPAVVVAGRAGGRLAFIAALQYLPPRQRAVLILRDVRGGRAAEVADLLATTTAGVNSALQRARAHLQEAGPAEDELTEPADPLLRALLDRYVAAFAAADVAALL